MTMTDEEVLRSFRQAKKPSDQVQVLADLNSTTTDNIREILVKQGVDPRQLPRKKRRIEQSAPEAAAPVKQVSSFVDALKDEEGRLQARYLELEELLTPFLQEQAALSVKLELVRAALAAYDQ